MIEIKDNVNSTVANSNDNIVWENSKTCVFAMSMLCRESGLIFAYVGAWDSVTSDTSGPMYHVYAMDSYNGRIVWKIPIGRGIEYCHEYGGIYFSRPSGNMLVVGTCCVSYCN